MTKNIRTLCAVLACVAGGSLLSTAAEAGKLSVACMASKAKTFPNMLGCMESGMTKDSKNHPNYDLFSQEALSIFEDNLAFLGQMRKTQCTPLACQASGLAKETAGINRIAVLEALAKKPGAESSVDTLTTGEVTRELCQLSEVAFQRDPKAQSSKTAIAELPSECQ